MNCDLNSFNSDELLLSVLIANMPQIHSLPNDFRNLATGLLYCLHFKKGLQLTWSLSRYITSIKVYGQAHSLLIKLFLSH